MVERLLGAFRRLLEVVEHACCSVLLCRTALAACRERCCSFLHPKTELLGNLCAAVCAVSDTQKLSVEAFLVCLQPLTEARKEWLLLGFWGASTREWMH